MIDVESWLFRFCGQPIQLLDKDGGVADTSKATLHPMSQQEWYDADSTLGRYIPNAIQGFVKPSFLGSQSGDQVLYNNGRYKIVKELRVEKGAQSYSWMVLTPLKGDKVNV